VECLHEGTNTREERKIERETERVIEWEIERETHRENDTMVDKKR
jgi:hypothetical protein